MAAVRLGDQTVLITVDQVADGVHVDLATAPIEKVGRKAITRNLSDVAAMAAKPIGAVVAASLPRDFGEARTNELFDAMRATAEHYACPLVGGDISIWDGALLLTVTVFAEPNGIEPVTRRGAKVGDSIFVTGELGGSLQGHHLDFEPRIDLARRLAGIAATRPHCMIDLSDGLARDLVHLCDAADVTARVDADRLPLRDATLPWRRALCDGEDYELCFTIDAQRAADIPGEIEGVPITAIGHIMAPARGERLQVVTPDQTTESISGGWEHRGS